MSDLDIARGIPLRPIEDVALDLGLRTDQWRPYGRYVAKVDPAVLKTPRRRAGAGRLVLVSAMTPTPAGEGKTTTSIGLAQGLSRLGQSVCLTLREPSLGPSFGKKGGATGGGLSQIAPADRINLHFTGDFHAVTTAHNLLAAVLDNHIYFGNALGIDPRRVIWPRVMDMNDRALRQIVIGLGGPSEGVPRQAGFEITAASEVMAILCLADGAEDLRSRLNRVVVAFNHDGHPVTASDLKASGAMLALLRDALWPNLVQTLEGVPTLVHGGPFANIAHGCNSVVATRTALHLADWVVTEAGFGVDLGAEKFFDIKSRSAGLDVSAVVVVATIRALKFHGGASLKDLSRPDPDRVSAGLSNLERHIKSVQAFGDPPVVALNRFADDTEAELEVVRSRCEDLGVSVALSEHHARGGAGAEELARLVIRRAEDRSRPYGVLYELDAPFEEKVRTVARRIYGAGDVILAASAQRDLADIRRLGFDALPICVAKTPASLSDDPLLRGCPEGFSLTVRRIQVNAGAGFLVVLTGDILRMPGLPRTPHVEAIDLQGDEIVGLG